MKEPIIIAIESSCDETAVAILRGKRELLANEVSTQIEVHETHGGVIPEIASRLHVEAIGYVIDVALEKAGISLEEIDAVAFTYAPGLIGSLHIGSIAAKTIALALEKPLIAVHHLAGHIYANNLIKDLEFPLMALVVSGGHTELVYMKNHLEFEIIGQTLDDAIGEAYDKCARVLGLGYPGGPIIDKYAYQGSPSYKLPKPLNDNSYNFSYSGLKSAVINLIHNETQRGNLINKEDLSCSFQTVAVESLVEKTMKAVNNYDVKQVVLAGGVSANRYLRSRITEECNKIESLDLILPPMWCCTDNAAMIAAAAYYQYEKGDFSSLDVPSKPNKVLDRQEKA